MMTKKGGFTTTAGHVFLLVMAQFHIFPFFLKITILIIRVCGHRLPMAFFKEATILPTYLFLKPAQGKLSQLSCFTAIFSARLTQRKNTYPQLPCVRASSMYARSHPASYPSWLKLCAKARSMSMPHGAPHVPTDRHCCEKATRFTSDHPRRRFFILPSVTTYDQDCSRTTGLLKVYAHLLGTITDPSCTLYMEESQKEEH